MLAGGGRLGLPGRLPEAPGHLLRETFEEGRGEGPAVLVRAPLGEPEGRLGLVAEAEEQRLGPLHVGGEAEDVRTGSPRLPPGRSTRRSRCERATTWARFTFRRP